ncbi:UNVERIFIED_ORG: hypothetical protein M2435_001225 [Rhizobium sophorae]|nr:hypothetical protein [Rhizobium leguminosarum]MDH6658326.1 hypothetical protein [Rhizobium sophorae]
MAAGSHAAARASRLRPAGCAPQHKARWSMPRQRSGSLTLRCPTGASKDWGGAPASQRHKFENYSRVRTNSSFPLCTLSLFPFALTLSPFPPWPDLRRNPPPRMASRKPLNRLLRARRFSARFAGFVSDRNQFVLSLCQVNPTGRPELHHLCDSRSGASGDPLLTTTATGRPAVVGIHLGNGEQGKRAFRADIIRQSAAVKAAVGDLRTIDIRKFA